MKAPVQGGLATREPALEASPNQPWHQQRPSDQLGEDLFLRKSAESIFENRSVLFVSVCLSSRAVTLNV